MKKLLVSISAMFIAGVAMSQTKVSTLTDKPDPAKKLQVVEASCGECNFGLTGKSCDLAVRIGGKSYFVDGTSINDHGDAHAKDGFCEAVRKAEVQGEIVDGRFKATYFKLVKVEEKKEVAPVKSGSK
jgi:hypothetical protein